MIRDTLFKKDFKVNSSLGQEIVTADHDKVIMMKMIHLNIEQYRHHFTLQHEFLRKEKFLVAWQLAKNKNILT